MPKIPTFEATGSIEQLAGTTSNIKLGLNNTLANALEPVTKAVVNHRIKENDLQNRTEALKLENDFYVKPRVNGKRKGASYERQLAKKLNLRFNTKDFSRTPGSGAFATTHTLPKHLQIHGDLITPENFKPYARKFNGKIHHHFAITWQDYFIWGATAGMLRNLSQRLMNI